MLNGQTDRVTELESIVDTLRRDLSSLRGDGGVARFHGDIDLGGARILNLRRSIAPDEAVARDEILDPDGTSSVFAPKGAQYVVVALDGSLTNERALKAGTNVTITDAGANGNITISAASAGSSTTVIGETPSGSKNGTNKAFTLANTPTAVDSLALYLAGTRLERVGSSPNSMQFVISGANLTLGLAPASTDLLFADYLKAVSATTIIGELPTGTKDGTNKTFTLASTPTAVDDVALFMSGVRLERVGASPNSMQFTLSGTTITTGLAPRSTDSLFADYTT